VRRLLAVALCACATPAAPPPSREVPLPPATAEPAPPPAPVTADLQTSLCRAEPGCRILVTRPVVDERHVVLTWHPTTTDAPVLATEGTRDTFEPSGADCQVFRYWLVADPEPPRLLLEICNDGHGAAGMGVDEVTVADNGLSYTTSGGSTWRWSQRSELRLHPFALLEVEQNAWWSADQNTQTLSWSWERFAGHARWYSPRCGVPPVEPGEEDHHAHVLVPDVTLEPAMVDEGWKVTALGACAARIDGTAPSFLLGGAAEPRSAELRVLSTDGGATVLVEVRDDRFTKKGASVRDELEIWADGLLPDYGAVCIEAAAPPRGAIVHVGDLRQRPARKGLLSPIAALDWSGPPEDGRPLRFRVDLRDDAVGSITVIYRDSDDGLQVARTLASSRFDAQDRASLGVVRLVGPDEAVCEVRAGALEPRVLQPRGQPGP
jgi:hypothetical protein